jgi:EAL domain-containing protein (putative c-di-GMP-specific phosphodiesterase class I)
MEVSSSNTERLDALKKLGVQLAVDDFGTGYSSLQYLKRFPFDWLKIAKPFVDGVGDSDAQARIARAIVDLSHSLEIEVIAEGIESRRQSAVLGEIGCLHGQGFHYSPPLPAEEISEYLVAGSAAR